MTNENIKELLNMEKHFESSTIELPAQGEKLSTPLKVLSDNTHDVFYLDADRKGSITLTKKKLQERHHNSGIIMIRLEIDCKPHMYPDGHKSSRNHIHIFSETGMQTYNLDEDYAKIFTDTTNFTSLFEDFCKMCKISLTGINIQGVI